MRKKSKILLFVTAIALIALGLLLRPKAPTAPSISVGSVRYFKSVVDGAPVILVAFEITNKGSSTIIVNEPARVLRVEADAGWTVDDLRKKNKISSLTFQRVIPPGASFRMGVNVPMRLGVQLPMTVKRWQVGYVARVADGRYDLDRRFGHKWTVRIDRLFARWISRDGPKGLVWGQIIEAKDWVDAHRNDPVAVDTPFNDRKVFLLQ
jgi:hypothetical protein